MREFYKKHERHMTLIAFLIGFIIDNLTIQRVDRWFEHLFLILHICSSGFLIIIYNSFDLERHREWRITKSVINVVRFFPVLIQFSLGAVFSGSLVFYSRSASLSVSWVFLVIIIAFVIGNEVVKSRYARLAFQLSGFFVALFLYLSFALPILVGELSPIVFVAGGIASLFLALGIAMVIKWISRDRFIQSRFFIYTCLTSLLALFNVLYFRNLIPPLPLSIKEIGVYHSVSRESSGDYVLKYEPAEWHELRLISPLFHNREGDLAFVYSSVFAPSRIKAEIVHEWFKKDERTGLWISRGVISFPIVGGRQEGYRGYTSKEVSAGRWRVDVKTDRGALIGRTSFSVIESEKSVVLDTLIR